jgi:TolB-like protein
MNVAQRVLDCGDAGHILLSKHVAEDLAQYRHWQPYLHDLGECEVKHGLHLHLFNLYKDNLGNPQIPQKLKRKRWKQDSAPVRPISQPRFPKLLAVAFAGSAVALAISSLIFFYRAPPPAVTSTVSRAAPNNAPFSIPEKSVAVLPFENLSKEKENAYFADGVQLQYKTGAPRNLREIGTALGVAHVVEGSVQRAGNRVRVNAQLIDARTDRQLWAQTYDRDLADVFAIQSEIAMAIARQLQARLSPGEQNAIEQAPTDDITAFDLYTRANNLLLTTFSSAAKARLLGAADLLNQAVARDPSFLQAYCQLAYAHDSLYFLGLDHTPARLALAEAAIQGAFRVRPDAGEAHLARARHLYHGYLDYHSALAELEIARRSLPNDPRVFALKGYIERRQGRWQESTRNLERSIDLDPRNFYTLQQIAISYGVLRRYAEETSVLDRALTIEPTMLTQKWRLRPFNFIGRPTPSHYIKRSIQFEPQIPALCRVSPIIGSAAHWPRAMLLQQEMH